MIPPDYLRANRDPRLRGEDRAVLAELYALWERDDRRRGAWHTLHPGHLRRHLPGANVRRAVARLVAFGYLERLRPAARRFRVVLVAAVPADDADDSQRRDVAA